MTDTLRLAHCADIHLDGSAQPPEFYREAFLAALAEIRAHAPDLMLLPGDLFDSNRATPATIAWAMDTLAAQPFPIVMIPGNHDCMETGAIFSRHDFAAIPNVSLLAHPDGETAHLPELSLAAWGKGMVEHHPGYSPLGGCPSRPDGCRWYVALAHGLFVPKGSGTDRSSPIHLHELEATECDYIALGHHHAALEIATPRGRAAFSGSPTDRLGKGATYIIADLAGGAPPAVAIHTVAAAAAWPAF